MKQFTTPEQTAKLIELGFEKPKSEVKAEQAGDYAWYNPAYSIGELIGFLPCVYNGEPPEITFATTPHPCWRVRYTYATLTYQRELIDALYEMLIKLKEEGVI